MRERDEALDFLRAVSMLAVVMIHVSSVYAGLPSRYTVYGMNGAYLLNQAARFSVPLFLLLSGASLRLFPPASLSGFYISRGRKLILPYIFWSALYFLSGTENTFFDLFSGRFLRLLLNGGNAPQLYFVVVLCQCYFIYPILRKWAEQSTTAFLLLSCLLTYLSQECLFFLCLSI